MVPQYIEEPRYNEYHRPESYHNTSPSPPQLAPNSYLPSAPAYHYQENVPSGSAQSLHPQSLATPSSPSGQRRNKWASIAEQTYSPVVSPPLPDHRVLVHRQDTPSTVMTTMPPSPTSTLDYEPQPQAHDVHNGSGWTQQPDGYNSFEHRSCDTCGQQKDDQGFCHFCGNADRRQATGQYMHGHIEPWVQHDRNHEDQSMIGHTPVHEDVTKQESPQTHDTLANNTHGTDKSASVGTTNIPAASALGYGGPSDWEYFGVHTEDEIDDTYLFSPNQNGMALPTDAAELPSKSTPPPNVHEQEQANQIIEAEPVPIPPSQASLPAETFSSKAGLLTLQTTLPPLPIPQPAVVVPRTSPVPPTRSTSENISTPIETSQSIQVEQRKTDEAIIAGSGQSKVSTDIFVEKPKHQQQASRQLERSILPKLVDSGHIEIQAANQTNSRPTASQTIVLEREEVSGERPQGLSSTDLLYTKPIEHDEKSVLHQVHSPKDPYSDLDSWAKASLSRFVVMLRSEASASTDNEKLHVFTSLMSKESMLRAVLYGAMPNPSADGIDKLAQPAPVVTKVINVEANSVGDVLVNPPQIDSIPSGPVGAPLSHRNTLSPSEVHLASTERSVLPAQSSKSLTTNALVRRDSSPHPLKSLQQDKDHNSQVNPEPQHDQELAAQLRDAPRQREKVPISDIETNQSGRALPGSKEPTPLENPSKAAAQNLTTREEPSTLAISIPDSYNGTESEADIEYSPGGRPIVSRPSRGPTRSEQYSKDNPKHTSPSQEVATRASASQGQHSTGSHSPGADAPIVVDIAWDSHTPASPTAGAAQRISSPTPPAVANEHPAYAPNRRTESSSRAFEQPSTLSKYRAYSALDRISFNAGTTMRTASVISKERDALDLASQRPEVHVSRGLSEAIDALQKILPAGRTLDAATGHQEKIAAAKYEIETVQDEFGFIKKTVVAWDAEAKKTREKNERNRRLRQEQSEEKIDGLFHDNEIGYSDIGALEVEYKKKEAERRAQEENDEQESFVRNVFETVTGKIQGEIDHLSSHYGSLNNILDKAVACKETFDLQEERPEISQVLEVVLTAQAKLEVRHRKVVEAVLEKERRFRKAQLAPLYTEGKITEMKKLEKQFDLQERELILEAARKKDERANNLIHTIDEHTQRGIKDNQEYTMTISGGIRAISEAMSHASTMDDLIDSRAVLTLASSTLSYLLANSLKLTQQSNAADVILNDADYDLSMADAKVANAGSETFKRLKEEKAQEDVKLKEDLRQRIRTVKTVSDMVTEQVEALVARVKDVESNGVKDGRPLPEETKPKQEGPNAEGVGRGQAEEQPSARG